MIIIASLSFFPGCGKGDDKGGGEGKGSGKAQASGKKVQYPLDTFVVNLSGDGGRRYLKVKMTLEVDEGWKAHLSSNGSKLRDTILILLSSKSFDDIGDAEGKHILRKQLKERLDKITDNLLELVSDGVF